MAAEEEVVILTRAVGTTAFIRDMDAQAAAVEELGVASDTTGLEMERAGKRSWLMNQAMFTLRRLAYGTTLALIATGVAGLKMGFNFNSAMQQASVALKPVAADIGGVHNELIKLFNFTKYTPFQFKDVTIAFRQMFLGMRTAGITADEVNKTLHSMVDALSATGRTSPGALNRVAVALQHMAYQGHLTGYTVNQLARDGIPIFAALRKELNLTGDQIHNIGSLGIPAKVALQAINQYIETTPGFANAAYRQATQSLHGQFTTFKDNISMLFGNMETGVFKRFQGRLTSFNKFFGDIANEMQKKASMADVIGKFAGGTAEFVWKQFAADLTLAWNIFSGFIRDVVHSKATWGILISALVLLHGILIPINFMVQHFGWALDGLLPLLLTWWIYTKYINTVLAIQRWLLAWDAGETDALALSTIAANTALRIYMGTALLFNDVLSAMSVLLTGTAIGESYRALTSLELFALRARKFFLGLRAAVAAVTGELWAMLAPILADPLFWVIAAVVAFGILYWKVKWFRDQVNSLVKFLWNHPFLAWVIPVIGPLVQIAKLLYTIYKHLKDIEHLATHPWNIFGIGKGSGGWNAWNPLPMLKGLGGWFGIPGMAAGGTVRSPGTAIVGEHGPELLNLPRGASVQPLGLGQEMGAWQSNQGPRQPVQIQFVVGRRVLEEAIVDIIGGRLATT